MRIYDEFLEILRPSWPDFARMHLVGVRKFGNAFLPE